MHPFDLSRSPGRTRFNVEVDEVDVSRGAAVAPGRRAARAGRARRPAARAGRARPHRVLAARPGPAARAPRRHALAEWRPRGAPGTVGAALRGRAWRRRGRRRRGRSTRERAGALAAPRRAPTNGVLRGADAPSRAFGRAAVARGALARPDPRAPRSYSIAASLPCARLARRAEVDARRARGGAGTAALGFAVATREVGGGGWLVLDGSRLRVESKSRCEHICVVLARSLAPWRRRRGKFARPNVSRNDVDLTELESFKLVGNPESPSSPPNHRWNPTQVRRAGLRLGAAAALRGRRRGAGARARGVLLRRAVGDRPLRARARGVRAAAAAAARPHIGPRRHSAARPPVGALASPRARAAQRRRRRRQRHGPQRRAPRGSRRVVEQPRRARAARAPRARPAPRRAARAAVL